MDASQSVIHSCDKFIYLDGFSNSLLYVHRFDEIMHHLHFSDNASPKASTDRAWKIRPIVETLQRTFKQGYTPGPVLSFDEGMIPSHSKYNGTRRFMRDKPHKWGTKMFLTCCPKSFLLLFWNHAKIPDTDDNCF